MLWYSFWSTGYDEFILLLSLPVCIQKFKIVLMLSHKIPLWINWNTVWKYVNFYIILFINKSEWWNLRLKIIASAFLEQNVLIFHFGKKPNLYCSYFMKMFKLKYVFQIASQKCLYVFKIKLFYFELFFSFGEGLFHFKIKKVEFPTK